MSKITPGEWTFDGNVVRGEDGYAIAVLSMPPDNDGSRMKANGQAIAALPGLLEALKACLPGSCGGKFPGSPLYALTSGGAKNCGRCCYCVGTAALAKAEPTK